MRQPGNAARGKGKRVAGNDNQDWEDFGGWFSVVMLLLLYLLWHGYLRGWWVYLNFADIPKGRPS